MIQLRPWIPATEQQQEPVVPVLSDQIFIERKKCFKIWSIDLLLQTRASINSVPVGQNPLMQLRPWFVDSSSSSGSTSGNSKQSKPWLLEEVVVLPATLRFPVHAIAYRAFFNLIFFSKYAAIFFITWNVFENRLAAAQYLERSTGTILWCNWDLGSVRKWVEKLRLGNKKNLNK